MPNVLMITNRNVDGDQLGDDRAALTFYESDQAESKLGSLKNWAPLSAEKFRERLIEIAKTFPFYSEEENEKQKHVSFFIHGYNTGWDDAVKRYAKLNRDLYSGAGGLGQLVLFTWPSNATTYGYLPDREDARASGPDLAGVFVDLYEHLSRMQKASALLGPDKACKAKVSVISHSMGNYVLQKALAVASRQLNNPQLMTLVHQVAMVAADVDNDLFQRDQPPEADGSLMANLCYRLGALYTGRDEVLGASAGLKHFGKRRLGRSGLADRNEVYDNVFDLDVTGALPAKAKNIHSAVFEHDATLALLEQVLRGRDRGRINLG